MKRLFLVGYMGSGKTTTGKRLAAKYGLRFVDLDHYIEHRYFKTISKLFEEEGEDGFRKIESELLKEVAEFEDVIISTGGGTACFFDNMDFMNSKGDTVYLQASASALADYLITAKKDRPLIRDKSKEELQAFIKETLNNREPHYLKAKYKVDARKTDDQVFDGLLR
jgi:shikimate kinase